MDLKTRIKNYTRTQTIKGLFNLLPKLSNKNLVKMTYVAEKLAEADWTKAQLRAVRGYFQEDHPAVEFARRIVRGLSPNCRDKFVRNFIINSGITGLNKHTEYTKKHGYEPPWFILFSPTMRCNLKCTGCSTREYTKDTDLPLEIMDRVLTEAKKDMGVYFVVTEGGETFVREDLLDFYARHNDVFFQVYTNGTLIDKKMAARLAKLGNVAPAISVEGFEQETDQRRGKGVWGKVMQAMDNLKEAGVFFGFSATLHRHNADVVTSDEFFDFMINKGCYFGWYFQYIPLGKNPDISLMATPQQRNKLRESIIRVRRRRPLFIGDFWNDGPYVKGCIAARQYLHINNRGDVEPCAFMHFTVDNIRNKTLKEIMESPFFKAIRERQNAQEAPAAHSDNMLTPCCVIDQPWVLRELVKEHGARPTDGAGDILEGYVARALDEYSKKLHEIYDPIWKNDYTKFHEK
ncbi:MAG: radical SAM protein [Candidatus Omnitrophota bacterium]|nr:MAG: radical SAM protein [Candidatus Omnitrophota bacterium]